MSRATVCSILPQIALGLSWLCRLATHHLCRTCNHPWLRHRPRRASCPPHLRTDVGKCPESTLPCPPTCAIPCVHLPHRSIHLTPLLPSPPASSPSCPLCAACAAGCLAVPALHPRIPLVLSYICSHEHVCCARPGPCNAWSPPPWSLPHSLPSISLPYLAHSVKILWYVAACL